MFGLGKGPSRAMNQKSGDVERGDEPQRPLTADVDGNQLTEPSRLKRIEEIERMRISDEEKNFKELMATQVEVPRENVLAMVVALNYVIFQVELKPSALREACISSLAAFDRDLRAMPRLIVKITAGDLACGIAALDQLIESYESHPRTQLNAKILAPTLLELRNSYSAVGR